MPKLLFVLPEYDQNTASHFRYTVELAEELAKHFDLLLFIEYRYSPVKLKNIRRYAVQIYHDPFRSFFERLFRLIYWRLKGYKKVYVHYSYFTALISSFINRLAGGQTFYWHCEQRAQFETKFSFNPSIIKRKLLVDWPFRLILKVIHRLITCTEVMKDYYRNHFKVPESKILVAYNWVDVAALKKAAAKPDHNLQKKLKLSPADKVVLFIHWLSPRKGSQYLPAIFEKVYQKSSNLSFIIVGAGPDKITIEQFLKGKSYQSKISLAGAVANHEIPNYLSLADVVIVPSQNEEFGRVYIEAMSAGKPVIASQTLGTEAIFSDFQKQFLSPPGDIKSFVSHLDQVLNDQVLSQKLIKDGFNQVKKYDKVAVVNQFVAILND